MNFLLKRGIFLDPASKREHELDVLVDGSRIKRVGRGLVGEGARTIDARGKLVVPGLVDVHVHLREPGQTHKETIATGLQAAAAGGFTTVVAEPNTTPPVDTPSRLKQVLAIARQRDLVNLYSKACISKGQQGRRLVDVQGLKAAGAVALTDDGHPVPGKRLMQNALEKGKRHDILIDPHSEESEFYRQNLEKRNASKRQSPLFHMPPYTSEPAFIHRDIGLVQKTGARLHVAHVSLAESVKQIVVAKERGLPVTAEVTPHHLLLTADDAQPIGPNAKVNPPLRSKRDTEALKEALAEGIIDIIATDHAPHSPQEKALSWDLAPFGVIGLETALALVLTCLVKPGVLTLLQAIERMSTAPARIFRLAAGTLAEGASADLTVIDPEKKWKVNATEFHSKGRNCPFDGWELQGKAVMTIVSGRLVMKDGRITRNEEDIEAALD